MFREEYQQRDIEAAVAVAKSRNYLTDCVMMEHEDHVASKRRDEESDAVDKECSIYEELLEVRRALDQVGAPFEHTNFDIEHYRMYNSTLPQL